MSLAHASPHGALEETVQVIFPVPARVFETRAVRLRELAPGHMVGQYLESMALLTEAQLAALSGLPPLSAEAASRMPAGPREKGCLRLGGWRRALDIIVREMKKALLPEPCRAALARLEESNPDELDRLGQTILSGDSRKDDLAASAFLGAALQVHFTALASGMHAENAELLGRGCPACGFHAVAGLVHSGRKLRYLCCSLCASRWYVPRLTCTLCRSTEGIAYFSIAGKPSGVKAEACARCQTYLKLFYLEDTPAAEPLADDLATLDLDLLMSEQGFSRCGPNLLLMSGVEP